MTIRPIKTEDVEALFHMMCLLDNETPFMMYESGERKKTMNINGLRRKIDSIVSNDDLLLIAEDDDKTIVGYIWAERGKLNRILHTAYIVVGIREAYRHQGIGAKFFQGLDEWTQKNGIVRLCRPHLSIRV